MSFVSFQFLMFAILLLIIYFIVPKKWQWVILLIANFIFYAANGLRLCIYIIFTIITTYFAAICVENSNFKMKSEIKKEEITAEKKKMIKQRGIREKRILCAVEIGRAHV